MGQEDLNYDEVQSKILIQKPKNLQVVNLKGDNFFPILFSSSRLSARHLNTTLCQRPYWVRLEQCVLQTVPSSTIPGKNCAVIHP